MLRFELKPKKKGCELQIIQDPSVSVDVPNWSYSHGILSIYLNKQEVAELFELIDYKIDDVK